MSGDLKHIYAIPTYYMIIFFLKKKDNTENCIGPFRRHVKTLHSTILSISLSTGFT